MRELEQNNETVRSILGRVVKGSKVKIQGGFISNRDCTIRPKHTSLEREEQKGFGGCSSLSKLVCFEGVGEDHRSD